VNHERGFLLDELNRTEPINRPSAAN